MFPAAARRGFVLSLLVASIAAGLTACAPGPQVGLPTGTLTFHSASGPVPIRVEIAETSASRQYGLMYRTSMAPNAGMAFIWRTKVFSSFHMKNTRIPLSIAFWDEHGLIHTILDMQPCHAAPCRHYSARAEFAGAVEVNQGFFAAHGVVVGDRVDLSR